MMNIFMFQHGEGEFNVKPTSLGKVSVPVNPNWTNSSLDGTQSDDTTPPCRATIISGEGLSSRPHNGQHSYSLHLSVTCHLSSSGSHGLANEDAQGSLNVLIFWVETLVDFFS